MSIITVTRDEFCEFQKTILRRSRGKAKPSFYFLTGAFALGAGWLFTVGQWLGGVLIFLLTLALTMAQLGTGAIIAWAMHSNRQRKLEQRLRVWAEENILWVSTPDGDTQLTAEGVLKYEEAAGVIYILHRGGFHHWFPRTGLAEEERGSRLTPYGGRREGALKHQPIPRSRGPRVREVLQRRGLAESDVDTMPGVRLKRIKGRYSDGRTDEKDFQ